LPSAGGVQAEEIPATGLVDVCMKISFFSKTRKAKPVGEAEGLVHVNRRVYCLDG
jgi:hypothetical protein